MVLLKTSLHSEDRKWTSTV